METYYWNTENHHCDNSETMNDYLENHLPDNSEVTAQDGTYAEIIIESGEKYGVFSSGCGDSFNHKVEFELIITNN